MDSHFLPAKGDFSLIYTGILALCQFHYCYLLKVYATFGLFWYRIKEGIRPNSSKEGISLKNVEITRKI
jgi:hypothetical protein